MKIQYVFFLTISITLLNWIKGQDKNQTETVTNDIKDNIVVDNQTSNTANNKVTEN